MKRLLVVLFALVLVSSLAAIGQPSTVSAQALSSDVVYVDIDNVAGPWDGTSWTTAYQTVQEGLDDAYLTGKEVWVAEGTYNPTSTTDRTISFQLKSGVALYGGFNGTETVREQRDWATNVTILSGDIGTPGDNSDNSYHAVVGDDNATLDGFTVTGGNANGLGNNGKGGGMFNWNSSPTVTNCTFYNNSAWDDGGGMLNWDSSPIVTNCTFSSNSAGWGGGIYNWESSPTVTNCTFYSNFVGNGGGGMYNHDYSSPTVTNCAFLSNSSNMGWGGGMHNHNYSSPIVTNCTFSSNSGGGMKNRESSPTITNCILWDNDYEISNEGTLAPLVTYSDIQGGYLGEGNISADPKFVDLAGGDYHLQSASPCIDAGTNDAPSLPVTDFEGDARILPVGGVVDMGADEYVPPTVVVEATVDFDPDTLNLNNKGKWVTTYIELPEGYDVGEIDISTVMLNGIVPALAHPTEVGDYDGDGVPDLMVKFDRCDVQSILEPGDEVEVTVSGELTDGTPFEGTDTIRVIDKGKK